MGFLRAAQPTSPEGCSEISTRLRARRCKELSGRAVLELAYSIRSTTVSFRSRRRGIGSAQSQREQILRLRLRMTRRGISLSGRMRVIFACRARRELGRQRIDHLSRPGIPQSLAGFLLLNFGLLLYCLYLLFPTTLSPLHPISPP